MNAIAFFSITIIPQVVHGMLVRVIPEINPNHASNLFYVKENYLAYAQSPETGNVSGRFFRKAGSLRGENPFYRKKGFSSLIWNCKLLFHIFQNIKG